MAIKWPIYEAGDTGIGLLESYEAIATQNLIFLLLTNPGERTMDSDFGVGLRHMLFENIDQSVEDAMRSEIFRQVAIYLPYIEVSDVLFASSRTDPDVQLHENYLGIQIKYSIPEISSVSLFASLSVGDGGGLSVTTSIGGDSFSIDGARSSGGSAGLLDVGATIPGYDDSPD